jgi:hypothetical protein
MEMDMKEINIKILRGNRFQSPGSTFFLHRETQKWWLILKAKLVDIF